MMAAGVALARALERRGPCRVLTERERPWGSATFEGARHCMRLEMAAGAAAGFLAGIEADDFDLGEHLLADLVVMGREAAGPAMVVAIEALTIMDRR